MVVQWFESFANNYHLHDLVPIFVSFVALLVAYWTARIQGRSVLTSLFLDFSERYNSREMREAMLALSSAYLDPSRRKSFAQTWYAGFVAGDAGARGLDNQRRLINRYFGDLVRLNRYGHVNRKFVQMAGRHYAINVYYRVVHPMNQLMFSSELEIHEFERDYKELRRLIPKFGNGLLTGEGAARQKSSGH